MGRRQVGSIQRRGTRFFVRVTRPDGTRTTRGSWPTARAAELALPEVVREVLDDYEGTVVVRESPGLMGFWEREWEESCRGRLSGSTLRSIVRPQVVAAARWLAERGVPSMRAVTRADAEAYVAHLTGRMLGSTAERHVTTVAQAWDAARSRGYVDANPWRRLSVRKDQERAVPWVSPADVRRLVAATAPAYRDLVQLLVGTGLRKGEALALDWRDVDLVRGVVLVRRSKGRTTREVPLVPEDAAMLERRRGERAVPLEGPDPVFPRVSKDGLMHGLDLACARCHLPRLRVHDLRHVYASHLMHAGEHPGVVAGLLGHQDGGALVLRRYGRWRPESAAADAVARLAELRRAPTAKPGRRPG